MPKIDCRKKGSVRTNEATDVTNDLKQPLSGTIYPPICRSIPCFPRAGFHSLPDRLGLRSHDIVPPRSQAKVSTDLAMPQNPRSNRSRSDSFSFSENFERHKLALFTTYRRYFLVFCLSAVADAASTKYFMEIVGPRAESNFYVRTLSLYLGITAGPILGKLLQVFALWCFSILAPRLTRFVCLILIAINFTAVIVNYASFTGKSRPVQRRRSVGAPQPINHMRLVERRSWCDVVERARSQGQRMRS